VTLELRSKGIDYGRLTAFSEGTVDTSQIQGVNPDLRVRPLFAEGRDFSTRVPAVNAWRNAMGLIAEDPDFAAAAARENPSRVVTPTGFVLDGTLDTFPTPPAPRPEFGEAGFEIPVSLVDFMEFYLLHYFTPGTYQQTRATALGRKVMEAIGCTRCHIPYLPLERDRRVADIQTVYDQERGVFNSLFATANPLFRTVDDGTGFPSLKQPSGGSFLVENIFTDFKRHDLGPHFHERNFNGTMTTQFMTLPLWGVGNTPPYGHDGRSINLREVILRHGGEAQTQRDAFAGLPEWGQEAVIRFLESLVIFRRTIPHRPSIPATRKPLVSLNEGTGAFGCRSCSTTRAILNNAWIPRMEMDGVSKPMQRMGGVNLRTVRVRRIIWIAQILL
jgi:Di-haem oxidoreductase, putative peroxidase